MQRWRRSLGRLLATLPPSAWNPFAALARLRDELEATKRLVARLEGELVGRSRAEGPPLLFTPPKLNDEQQALVDRFHTFMYDITDENSFRSFFVSWLGYGMLKWPTDLWNYQEIVVQTKPDVIVETGTHRGGSALFLASICELIDKGEVISIDTDDTYRATQPKHPRLTFLSGSSTDPNIVAEVKRRIAGRTNVFVILDSDHHCNHVLNELRIYSELVPINGYLVVEDTNVNGHPAYPEFGPGPREAVDLFLRENSYFEIDRMQERFYLTQNPCGFLRRRPLPAWNPFATLARLRDELEATKRLVSRLEGELVRRRREKTSLEGELVGRSRAEGPPLLFTPPKLNDEQQALVDRFHTFMYDITDENSFRSFFVSWLGYGMLKWPTDLWNYQEIVVQTKPDVIVETGTHRGGSALFLASICELIDKGEVISIDTDDTYRATQPKHPRLTFLSGSSTDPNIVAEVKRRIAGRTNVFVILDSDHHCNHVLNELRIYSELVPINGYLVVEDTNVNGHPAYPEFGPGPREAVDLFLRENSYFEVDRMQERFYLTQNPCGFLRRRSNGASAT